MAEVNESSTHCQKERLARSQQDEREKNMQAAMLETEARRRDLDSRLWLLEERRKQVHCRFIVYVSTSLNQCALASMCMIYIQHLRSVHFHESISVHSYNRD